ncbi:MAG: radical SAM protein [bacterium]
MKIILIIPPSPFLGDQKRNPSLGVMYIAAFLEKQGYDVGISDLRNLKEEYWLDKAPVADVYGLTAATPEYPLAVKIARHLKSRDKKCLIVLGGIHATADKNNLDPVFDSVITGEGELAMLDLLKDFEKGSSKKYYQGSFIENLDELPFPARHLLPLDSVFSDKLCIKGEMATSIIASRGCPYNCSFCASKAMWGRKVRFRSPDNVIAEIKEVIEKYNVRQFRFQDDTIAANRDWLFELAEKMKPLNIVWRANNRVNCSQKDILLAMKEAGCYEIDYGIESLSENVLKINNKLIKVEDIYAAVKTAKDVGLKIRLFFMIGLPGQNKDEGDKIIKFIEEVRPDGVDVSTLIPFPGCDIYNDPSKYNIEILNRDFSSYVFTLGLYGDEAEKDFIFKHDILSNEELKQERRKILEYIRNYNLTLNK